MSNIFKKIVKRLKNQYKYNTNTKIGEKCICPSCGDEFVKKTHDQKFCGRYDNACHEYYWNLMSSETLDVIEKIN